MAGYNSIATKIPLQYRPESSVHCTVPHVLYYLSIISGHLLTDRPGCNLKPHVPSLLLPLPAVSFSVPPQPPRVPFFFVVGALILLFLVIISSRFFFLQLTHMYQSHIL